MTGLRSALSKHHGACVLLLSSSAVAGVLCVWKVAAGRRRLSNSARPVTVAILGDSFCDILAGVDRLPAWGADVVTKRPLQMMAGGSALNTAVQLSHLTQLFPPARPLSVTLHSVIGHDSFGAFLRTSLRGTRVRLYSPSDVSVETGACLCLSGQRDRAFITYRGSVHSFNASQIDLRAIYTSQALHVAGFFNCPGLWPALPELLAECRRRGILTVLTPQFDATERWEGLESLWPHIDVFIPNEVEAAGLSGRADPEEAASWFVERGVRTVVVTLGEQGALALQADGRRHRCSTRPTTVVDTTGAGDGFCAGFLFALLQHDGDDVGRALEWGCAMGRAVVGCFGASTRPDKEKVVEGLPPTST